MTEKLGIGIIGCGTISAAHAQGYAAVADKAKIVATCDVNADKAKKAQRDWEAEASYTNHEDLLARKDIHAVSICLPHNLHAPVAVKAAKAGKHILCEKPIATSLEEADKMIAAAGRARVKLMIGQSERFDTAILKVKELLNDDGIGRIFLVRATFEYYPEMGHRKWMTEGKAAGGGVLINVGSHKIDLVRHLTGEAGQICAFASKNRPDFNVEDSASVILKFKNGAIGEISVSFAVKNIFKLRSGLWLFGSKGTIEVSKDEVIIYSEKHKPTGAFHYSSCRGDGIREEIKQFVNCIIENRPSPVSGEEGKKSLAVTLAAYRSIREKRMVNF